MKITKLGHCCLVIEVNRLHILTDPGAFSTSQNDVKNIDIVLITHEHPDHLHVESLMTVLKNSPNARVITNKGVGKILEGENIKYELIENGQSTVVNEVSIEGHGEKHADIYPTINPVDNTGYFINEELFYPGDAFTVVAKKVKILALPVAGPWLKISEVIDYAKQVAPQFAFPVHDGGLKILGPVHVLPQKELKTIGTQFIPLKENDTYEFN